LERVVFSSATFARWWPGRLRLVKIDFTRTPPMTPAIEQARMELARRYGVTGFPTVLFLAADGRELGRLKALGPFDLGPDRWLAEADRLLNITP
jgi:thioredoxin-related protein